MKIQEEKELKRMIARFFNTRTDKVEITKTETDNKNGRVTYAVIKGYSQRIEDKNGIIQAVYRVI